jgi:hypothetical protein
MKAKDEWSALMSKVAGLEQGYKRTACIFAMCPLSELADSNISLNPFCKVSVVKEKMRQSLGSSFNFFAGHKSEHVRCLLQAQIAQFDFENSLQVVLENGEAHSVIGSLDLNQGCQLPGELSGNYPEVHFAHICCQHSWTRTSCSNSQF